VNAIAPAFENVNFSAAAINYASVHALSFRCVAIASLFLTITFPKPILNLSTPQPLNLTSAHIWR
jgi:hypothetical protein